MFLRLFVSLVIASLPVIAQADVVEVGDGGFVVSHTVNTNATPEQSWSAMVERIDEWWHPEHTWSGDSANLYIKPELGGCFCERLPNGGVEHLRIIYFKPIQEIHFDGSLGPFQTMAAQGRMVWKVEPRETGSSITFTYLVHGFTSGGFTEIAPAVDGVVTLQLDRLAQALAAN